jgi:hypothetical protein
VKLICRRRYLKKAGVTIRCAGAPKLKLLSLVNSMSQVSSSINHARAWRVAPELLFPSLMDVGVCVYVCLKLQQQYQDCLTRFRAISGPTNIKPRGGFVSNLL